MNKLHEPNRAPPLQGRGPDHVITFLVTAHGLDVDWSAEPFVVALTDWPMYAEMGGKPGGL